MALHAKTGLGDVALAGNGRGNSALAFERVGGIAVALARPGRNFGPARHIRGSGGGSNPQVAVDERGSVLVLWRYNDHSRGPDPRDRRDEGCCVHIRLAWLRAGGKRFSRPKSVGTPGSDANRVAFAIVNGRVGVAWDDNAGVSARFSRRGLRLGRAVRVRDSNAFVNTLAAVPLRTGPALTLSREKFGPNGVESWSIRELRVRSGRSPAVRTVLSRPGYAPSLALAANARGEQALAWSEDLGSYEYAPYAGTRTRTGSFRTLRLSGASTYYAPDVAIAPTGSAVAAWDDGNGQIYAARRTPGRSFGVGRPFGPRFLHTVVDDLQLALDSAGRALIGWKALGQSHLRAAFRTRDGRRVGLHRFAKIDSYDPQGVALDERGVARVGWRRAGTIYAARARFPGR